MIRQFAIAVAMASAALLGACADEPVTPRALPGGGAAPLLSSAQHARVVKDRYIVVFREDVENPSALAARLAAAHGGTLHYTYQHALKGFAATLTPGAVEGLRCNPHVAYIQPDQEVTATATQSPAPWALDRIDQRVGRNNAYVYQYTGSPVRVYVIDSGIDTTHAEFGGRARNGFDACHNGCSRLDPFGHGTQVAGVIGASTYGVAKAARLVSVRVLDAAGDGTTSTVAAGVDWVTGQKQATPAVAMVANISLIFSGDAALDAAVERAMAAGVTVVAGAGNEARDACSDSPARVPGVLTVGGLDKADAKVSSSNYGPCVDLYAPGQSILTTEKNNQTVTSGGTSLAAPHVSGFAAMYLHANPGASPAQVHAAAINFSTTGRMISLPAGSNNRILFTWFEPYVTVDGVRPSGPGEPANTLTATGVAWAGTGNVQPEWRDVTTSGSFVATPGTATPASDGRWSATIPASNYCHDYEVRARYSGVTSATIRYRGLSSGFCNESARVIWIQPAWRAGAGWTPGSLAVAGEAAGGPAGTPVALWWRNLSTGGPWVKVAYEPTTLSNGVWLNEIPNANFLQRYEVQVVYDVITSASCIYAGNNDITWC